MTLKMLNNSTSPHSNFLKIKHFESIAQFSKCKSKKIMIEEAIKLCENLIRQKFYK